MKWLRWSLPSLSWLRDGTHPLAVRPVHPGLLPRPGRSDRQRRWVPENPGPGRQIVSQDSPSGVSRIGGQAGTQAPTLRPHHRKTVEAGPGSTIHILPAEYLPAAVARTLRLPACRSSAYGASSAWQACTWCYLCATRKGATTAAITTSC